MIERLGAELRKALAGADPTNRQAYPRLFQDRVLVNDREVHMTGPTAVLAKAAIEGTELPTAGVVPSFVREWRPIGPPL